MPVATVSLPDGSTADIEYQEGATDDQILDFALKNNTPILLLLWLSAFDKLTKIE